jgi:hypothetical protein
MLKLRRFTALASLIVATVAAGYATPAAAQATRTWVSGVGDDVNPCSRTAPCKTFAGAISKTAINGEISVLDPGGFGSINITKSMTIDGAGINGSILAVNVNGVLVNGAGIHVTLRNLTINGAASTIGNGVRIIQAGSVTLDNVVIEHIGGTGTNGRGVAIETSTANVRVAIENSQINHVNNIAVHSNPTAGSVILSMDNVQIENSANSGIQIRQLTTATINRTSATNSTAGAGITLELTGANATVNNSNFSNNAFGVFNGNGGNPILRLAGTVVTNNTTDGLRINTGQVISSGNNVIRGNAGNEVPSSTITTQ